MGIDAKAEYFRKVHFLKEKAYLERLWGYGLIPKPEHLKEAEKKKKEQVKEMEKLLDGQGKKKDDDDSFDSFFITLFMLLFFLLIAIYLIEYPNEMVLV